MAAYHHVPSKAAILQGVVEAIMAELTLPDEPVTIPWQDGLRRIAAEYRRVLLAHPNALPVASTQPPLTPVGLRFIEAAAELLVRGGLTPVQAFDVINAGAVAVIGSVLAEAGVTPGSEPIADEHIEAVYAGLAPGDFPVIASVLAQSGPDAFEPAAQFNGLIEALVLGLERQFGA
jgi:AcrR family transcriptional regulator